MEHYTIYEYAYNGRVLGYVKSEDSVVSLLDVAGDHMSSSNGGARIKFVADNNVTFRRVSAAEKDVDDPDTIINKLTYMTDIEVSAYGIYQDDKLLTVVETKGTANSLVDEVLAHYKQPDKGMRIEQLKFAKPVEVKQLDVMLTSVQSKKQAKEQLLDGGDIKLSHIIKSDETIGNILRDFSWTQEELGKRLGKSRSYISNTLRLLKLETEYLEALKEGQITSSQARTLLAMESKERKKFYKKLCNKETNVREMEKAVKQKTINLYQKQIEEELCERFATKVRVTKKKQGGKIEFDFYSDDDLERVLEMFRQ